MSKNSCYKSNSQVDQSAVETMKPNGIGLSKWRKETSCLLRGIVCLCNIILIPRLIIFIGESIINLTLMIESWNISSGIEDRIFWSWKNEKRNHPQFTLYLEMKLLLILDNLILLSIQSFIHSIHLFIE